MGPILLSARLFNDLNSAKDVPDENKNDQKQRIQLFKKGLQSISYEIIIINIHRNAILAGKELSPFDGWQRVNGIKKRIAPTSDGLLQCRSDNLGS